MRGILIPLVFLAALSLSSLCADAASVKAYFNGQEATVENVSLKTGEPFWVTLTVVPDSDAVIHAMIYEPGLVPAYVVLEGTGKDVVVTVHVRAGEKASFAWKVAPSGEWTKAKAPLNVAYKVLEERDGAGARLTPGQFTVVNAFIEEKRYAPASPCVAAPAAMLVIAFLRGRKGT